MNMPTEFVNGLNGRSYRATPLTAEQKSWLIKGAHWYRHVENMSVRGIVAAFKENHGVRVSRGAVHAYLVNSPCSACHDQKN